MPLRRLVHLRLWRVRLVVENEYIPPTLNLDTSDPECDLDYTPNIGRELPVRTLITNSFGFGGINACLVMRKVEV
jgi:3-oxoacyl-(acyl-carrier-protein) synthase